MYATVEIKKGWDTWNKMAERMNPEMESEGMKFIFKGCEMDEKRIHSAFSNGKDKDAEQKEVERDHLYKQVGQLQIEVDWLKKRPAIWDECFRESQMYRRQK